GDGRESELSILRQIAARLRKKELHAALVPDLHDQRIAACGADAAGAGGRCDKGRIGQRSRHFLELVVEQRVRLVACAQIGADRSADDGECQAQEQPHQQFATDGFHAACGSGFATIQPTPRTLRMRSAPSLRRSEWMWTSTALLSIDSLQ